MVDDVNHLLETAESKDATDRARLARERREAEQRKRLDELRAHAAAAQAQREKRDEDRRRRQAEQRARDDDRRQQVEERKRAIWEASVSRREALLQRERERTERMDRARAQRNSPRSAFAFGSSTPRLLEPIDSAGFFWAARSTNPIDQMNFFESLAASTTNVMFASAPLTRPASALQLNSEMDSKDESDRQPQAVMWSSVARRRTDLVPTLPAPRAPGRAYSMTRLDKIPSQRPLHSASPSMHHLNRTRGGDTGSVSVATTPSVSRDATMAGGDVRSRPQPAPRRPRPTSMHGAAKTTPTNPADGKPPLHRKPKPSKEHEKSSRGKSSSASPGRTLSPSPSSSKEPSVDKEVANKPIVAPADKNQLSAIEVSLKLEALQIQNGEQTAHNQTVDNNKVIEVEAKPQPNELPNASEQEKMADAQKPDVSKPEAQKVEKKEDKIAKEKTDDDIMTASMTRRITTEEQAKAALAERRRRAREELEKQAELERQRLQREAEEEAERMKQEEERQKREEEEAKELARLQRQMDDEKLRKAIEVQQQLQRDEAERKAREEQEKQVRLKEEEDKKKAAEEAEKLRKEEAEREEKERLARKQRVEAIMARTRLKKQAEEDKKQQESKGEANPSTPVSAMAADNGNGSTGDLLGLGAQPEEVKPHIPAPQSNDIPPVQESNPTTNNGNVTADLLGLSEQNNIEDKAQEQAMEATNKVLDNPPSAIAALPESNNGNTGVGHISASFIQTERMTAEHSQKMPENVPKLIEDDFTSHNGHNNAHNHPLTLQNAI